MINLIVWLVIILVILFVAVRSNPELLRGVLRDALKEHRKRMTDDRLLEELLTRKTPKED